MSLKSLPLSVRCPTCQSSEVGTSPFTSDYFVVCHDCGEIFEADEAGAASTASEVAANLAICPHCETIDEVTVYGDQEICDSCGLDPNRDDYSPEEIAHLWKPRSEDNDPKGNSLISEVLLRGRGKPGTRLGNFIRGFCGPHCNFAEQCPQTAGNLATCFNEEADMGKRRKKKNRKASSNPPKESKKPTSWLYVAKGGWYSRVKGYGIESIRSEQSSGGET